MVASALIAKSHLLQEVLTLQSRVCELRMEMQRSFCDTLVPRAFGNKTEGNAFASRFLGHSVRTALRGTSVGIRLAHEFNCN